MDAKKISFGFSKVAKKPNILPSKQAKDENKVELIKCLEGKEIKLVAERVEAAPLVIEMQGSQKTSAALASLMKRRAVLLGEEEPDPEEVTPAAQSVAEVTAGLAGAENLEQRAARELLAASQNNGDSLTAEKLVLPAVKADELPLDGAKEATLDDYDNIPIQQFGLAMLRGMGWVDPPPKKKGSGPIDDAPFLRPKGMGLGADKALKPKALLVQPEKNEVLEIKKQAYVRILGGKQKDQYGQIEGFDDHAGRVIVKMAIGGAKEAFNEFLCQPVSRKEYSQYGKCINTAKYEEFKKQENEHGQIIIKQDNPTERREDDRSNRDDRKEQRSYKDEDRRRYKEEDRKPYKKEDKKLYKDEDRKSYKDEDRKSYKDEDRKSYKDDDRKSYKDDGRKPYRDEERKPYREDDRRAYKDEDRKEYKTERAYKEESRSHKYEDRDRRNHGQDSRSNSSSTSKRDDRERRRSPSPKISRRPKSSSDEAEDTGESTESDSDSAYERRKHKKSSSRKSRKHSKKSKNKSRRADDSSAESDGSSHEDHRRHPSKHKKKTKKSKHARSRTRSRSRGRGR
ncbi:hypothetical protein KR200_007038 [Drosophila serrata]|nr:hypothetical protein KR200_007038 [Drosophila serrata]